MARRTSRLPVFWNILPYTFLPRSFVSNKTRPNSLSFAQIFLLQLSPPLESQGGQTEKPNRVEMASFSEAPPGDAKVGEKIFKTKCAQCHTVEKGAGHKQGNSTVCVCVCLYYLLMYVYKYVDT